jgi:hypothetical protein
VEIRDDLPQFRPMLETLQSMELGSEDAQVEAVEPQVWFVHGILAIERQFELPADGRALYRK